MILGNDKVQTISNNNMNEKEVINYFIWWENFNFSDAQKRARAIINSSFLDRLKFKSKLPDEYKAKIFGKKFSSKYRGDKDKTLLNIFLAIMFFAIYPGFASYMIMTNNFMGITNLLIFIGGELIILAVGVELNKK